MLEGIKKKLAVIVPVIVAAGLIGVSLFAQYGFDAAFAGGAHN